MKLIERIRATVMPAGSGKSSGTLHDTRVEDHLDVVALALVTWAALCAVDLSPLRDPTSSVLCTYAGCAVALFIVGTRSLRGWGETAALVGLVFVAGWIRAPRELVLAASCGGMGWLSRSTPARAVRVAGVVSLAALVVGSLKRTFDPLLLDEWLHTFTIGWIPGGVYDAEVGPSIYGALLFPVGLAGLMATRARAFLRAAAVLALLGALFLGRHQESLWPIALAVVGLPAVLVASARSGTGREPDRQLRIASAGAWSLLAGLTLVLGWNGSGAPAVPDPDDDPPHVGFIGAMHGSFEPLALPQEGPKDPAALPRFGQFRTLLEDLGAQTFDVAHPEDVVRGDWDALVTINFSGPDARAFVEPVREAVRGGTDLLVLADHTDMFEQMLPTNDLLRGVGIELAFDSAVPQGLGAGWVGSVRAGRDPIFGQHRNGKDFSWGVGCSLGVQSPARTIASATRAFIDDGDVAKPGGLGNLRRDRTEQLGGYSLAASSSLGAGRILTFGDTSAVQDTALVDGLGFAKRVAAWLLGGGGVPAPSGGCAPLARLLLVLCLAGGVFGHLRPGWLFCALLSLGVAEPVFEHRMRDAAAIDTPDGARLVLLTQHSPGVPSDVDRIDAVLEQCASRGWRMSTSTDIGDAPAEGAAALFDPWTRIDEADSERILDYVRQGGRLLLFLGDRGARSAQLILDELGLSVGMPLGRGTRSAWEGPMAGLPGKPFFYSSRHVDGPGLSNADVLASCFGHPVAASGRLGRGEWLLVADPGLVLERHIEPQRGGTHVGALTLQHFLDVILERI